MTSYERSNFVTEAVTVGNGFEGDSEDFGGVWKWADSALCEVCRRHPIEPGTYLCTGCHELAVFRQRQIEEGRPL